MGSLARRVAWRSVMPVGAVILAVVLLVGLVGHHPQLSRQQAIDAALSKRAQQTAHYAAKLVRESDLEGAAPEWGESTGPDFFVWVIAASGDYGIHGESPGPQTWTVLLVNDERPAQLSGTLTGVQGNWPPFFDRLVDLS